MTAVFCIKITNRQSIIVSTVGFVLQRTVKIDIFVFGAEGTAAYKTGPVCSMPASCAGAIFNSGRSFR